MTNQEQHRRRTGTGAGSDHARWPRGIFERVEPAPRATPADPRAADTFGGIEDGEAEIVETVEQTVELAGVYIISVAARLLEMHPQTLRKYERFGLIRPSRTAGALRLYSDQDLARLRIVRRLVEELGLNLAGVRLLMQVVSELEQAIQAIEQDEASRQAEGARAAVAHMRAVLDFVNA